MRPERLRIIFLTAALFSTKLATKFTLQTDFFKKLAEGQSPEYLYIGCSDSRATAEELMGMKPGEVFVHRNIANLVNTLDMSSTAVIQYAVQHLKVKHIIVCGHYGCGGVKAAMTPQDFGLMNPWLRTIRDVYRLHQEELDSIKEEQLRYDRLIELNVQEQVFDLAKTSIIQQSWANGKFLQVHGIVYDIANGILKDLGVNFNSNEDMDQVYRFDF